MIGWRKGQRGGATLHEKGGGERGMEEVFLRWT